MAKRILDWQTSWLAMASPRTLANTTKEPQRAPIQRCAKQRSLRFIEELSDCRTISETVKFAFSFEDTFDIGEDSASPVEAYQSLFPFTGTIQHIDLDIAP